MSEWVLRRTAARVVLLDADAHVLLLEARDPADAAKGHWWEIPGGGIDPGEDTATAARRELLEETGITDAEIGPCVWTQHARFTFAEWKFDQHEHVHVAWCDRIDLASVQPAGLEAFEAMAFGGRRWWSIDALMGSTDNVLPVRLREFLPDLVAGRVPDAPIDITHTGPGPFA
ncbi:NUDIX hydrolase [Rhabdothermincola salaria]|uniref:NUDIX hydrolase n=1 Tax=Rhabdothermincola salaria TaxID=2903142 RepID=UPI001E5A0B58|nr:NUDIX domain-containing protein [Rhabdothermincola salaria]MCD9623546.1 NUDIX domain-containing protein [Rhabdothermincola salaria]